ncbi:MAG: hypothetical protein AAF657_06555 [Acidobacteriota bacterium]
MPPQEVDQRNQGPNAGWPLKTGPLHAGRVRFQPVRGGRTRVIPPFPDGWEPQGGGNAPIFECTAGNFDIEATPLQPGRPDGDVVGPPGTSLTIKGG